MTLHFRPAGRGKRWGEGALEYIGNALMKLVGELEGEGWASEVVQTPEGYDLIIQSDDFDGFHWTSLEIPMRAYRLTDFLVGL